MKYRLKSDPSVVCENICTVFMATAYKMPDGTNKEYQMPTELFEKLWEPVPEEPKTIEDQLTEMLRGAPKQDHPGSVWDLMKRAAAEIRKWRERTGDADLERRHWKQMYEALARVGVDEARRAYEKQQASSTDTEECEFVECPTCRAKPGMPVLCETCLHNRHAICVLKDQVDHWKIKAECYGNIVHGCSPALEAAGFPVDKTQPGGAVGGIARAVEELAKDRNYWKSQYQTLSAIVNAKAEADKMRGP